MKPSQRRKPPPPPAHNVRRKNNKAIAGSGITSNRVYDEPAVDVGNTDKKSSKIVKVYSIVDLLIRKDFNMQAIN